MNNKEFTSKKNKQDLNSYDILKDKYNYTEFSKEPFVQGGLRTKKLVEIGEEIAKRNYKEKKN